jgi:hypothetical protein
MLPVDVIDRSNCDAWDKPFEQRAPIRWEDAVGARLSKNAP